MSALIIRRGLLGHILVAGFAATAAAQQGARLQGFVTGWNPRGPKKLRTGTETEVRR